MYFWPVTYTLHRKPKGVSCNNFLDIIRTLHFYLNLFRVPTLCLGGHRFESCLELGVFLCPTLVTCCLFHCHCLILLVARISQINFQNLLNLSCTKIKIAKLFLYSISQGNTDLASVLGHGHFECFKLGVLVFAKFLCAVFISPFPPHSHCLFYCPLILNQFSLNFFL